jgi:tetratricopeptide (TPR) repeat protein
MAKDAEGHELSGANKDAALAIDAAVRAYTLSFGDLGTHLAEAERAAPHCAMAGLIRAWVLTLSNDPAQLGEARALLGTLPGLAMNEREKAHLAALDLAANGRWPSAVTLFERHLMAYPCDLMAHQVAMRLDGFLGRFHQVAGRTAGALPFWSKEQPGYGILLSFYGFGLEESGDYQRAEDISREAAALEPHGYWPHHAVSHVLEMTGRPSEGLNWMDQRLPFWAGPRNGNRVHIWWHKSLFHVELGQWQAALDLYDREILPTLRPLGTSLCNATALFWRLETLGQDVGDRWHKIFPLWLNRANGSTSPFNDIHFAMTALRAGERAAFDTLLASMETSAAASGELAPAYRDIGLPVVDALAKMAKGAPGDALEILLPVRPHLWRMGGSKAQRDLVDWTLLVAAVNAGNRPVAMALANERLAARPGSAVNQHLLEKAQAA